MKIAAKPMSLPHGEITEELVLTSPVGKATLDAIKEGIDKGFIKSKSVFYYLKDWEQASKVGTCYGQASAVMIADQGAMHGQEKEVMKRARLVDSICFQILGDLKGAAETALKATQALAEVQKNAELQSEKVEGKLKEAKKEAKNGDKKAKHKVEKLQKQADALLDPTEVVKEVKKDLNVSLPIIGAKAGVVGLGLLSAGNEVPAKEYGRKISNLSRSLVSEHGKLELVEKKVFLKQSKEEVVKLLKKLHADTIQQTVLRLHLNAKEGRHAIAFFIAPRLSIYDSNIGMTRHKTAESFFKAVEKTFMSKKTDYLHIDKYIIEIFKRKPVVT